MSEANNYFDQLDPNAFYEYISNRKKVIDAAEATALPKTYVVNERAKALHPEVQHLIIKNVVEHGNDAKSFELVPNPLKGTNECAYFRAGQYLSLFLDIDGSKVSKPYSICSGPYDALKGKYVITVKRSVNGFASEYILNSWKVGTEVETSGPEGNFYFEPLRDAKCVIGIAGGSGITPFHSLANAIADGIEQCSLILLYGSRTKDNILLKEEFDKLQEKCNKIKVVHVLSNEKADGFEEGFITHSLIEKYAPKEDYSIFLCGPQAMYDFADKEIEKLALPLRRIRHELFGQSSHPEKNIDYPNEAVGKNYKLTVYIRGERKNIVCSASETLLVAMERGGITAPSRCRSGECGFCHSRLISGDVFIPKEVDGRRHADIKFGYIHPCCSFPISNIEIDVPCK